ncbi:hypothetical protein KSS87_014007 [Heliosperma pusillum]|nr:hypothetical protein KSS87_014007 [Heliosperma pusillum]
MDWPVLIFSGLLVLWVASICKIMLLSNFPSAIQHFNNGSATPSGSC